MKHEEISREELQRMLEEGMPHDSMKKIADGVYAQMFNPMKIDDAKGFAMGEFIVGALAQAALRLQSANASPSKHYAHSKTIGKKAGMTLHETNMHVTAQALMFSAAMLAAARDETIMLECIADALDAFGGPTTVERIMLGFERSNHPMYWHYVQELGEKRYATVLTHMTLMMEEQFANLMYTTATRVKTKNLEKVIESAYQVGKAAHVDGEKIDRDNLYNQTPDA